MNTVICDPSLIKSKVWINPPPTNEDNPYESTEYRPKKVNVSDVPQTDFGAEYMNDEYQQLSFLQQKIRNAEIKKPEPTLP